MLLKLSKLLNNIAFILKSKAIYFEMKHYIKNREPYLKKINYYDRGIGKTYSLVKLALKYKAIIAVPNQRMGYEIINISKRIFKKSINIIVVNEASLGKRYDLVLCEEGISYRYINEILKPMCKCLIGYKSDTYADTFEREYECNWVRQ